MSRGQIIIPQSALGRDVAAAEALQRELERLLAELERAYSGRSATTTGGWRHDPEGWMERYGPGTRRTG